MEGRTLVVLAAVGAAGYYLGQGSQRGKRRPKKRPSIGDLAVEPEACVAWSGADWERAWFLLRATVSHMVPPQSASDARRIAFEATRLVMWAHCREKYWPETLAEWRDVRGLWPVSVRETWDTLYVGALESPWLDESMK